MTSQCHRLHGSRSIRPGICVVMVSPALAAFMARGFPPRTAGIRRAG